MPRLSRRAALLHAIALMLLPRLAKAQERAPETPPEKADLVVIGAGMAGLAAARQALAMGKKCVLLEARKRIGGRAFTGTRIGPETVTGIDLGAAFIRSYDANPLNGLLRAANWPSQVDDGDYWIFDQGKEAPLELYDSLGADLTRIEDALDNAREARTDRSLNALVKLESKSADLARALAGPLHVGVEFNELGALDTPSLDGTGNHLWLPGGLGRWVESLGAGLPIFQDHTVTRIEWSERGATVAYKTGEPREGRIEARAVICTLPLGVLQQNAVEFAPALPAIKREALGALRVGLIDSIALLYQPDSFDAAAETQLLGLDAAEPMRFRLNAQRLPVALARIGGRLARKLEEAGDEAMIQAARDRLKSLLGPGIDERFIGGAAHAWGRDPFALGSHSAMKPGAPNARRNLAQPMGRVVFAGEHAAANEWAGSLTGAWISGREAAAQAAKFLT